MVQSLGIDIGGTFTDFVGVDGDELRTWKRLSTPSAPHEAVVAGVEGMKPARAAHGSTVATNALLERRGPRVLLITTEGFKDLLEIRRQTRPRLYELEPRRTPHVVARGDVIEVHERMGADGEAVIPLAPEEITRVVSSATESGIHHIALCLLHSYRFPDHEARLAQALRDGGLQVSASIEVLPQPREYERASTTAINAFLREPVHAYVSHLERAIEGLRIMQSDASLAAPSEVVERPVSMVLSGPAGGVVGAVQIARLAGEEDIVTLDMGGTSTDVAVCPGEVLWRGSAEVDGLALHTSMVDIETVGAGGGSIAKLDPGGALVVGPESAGADPGPACYGRGELPTVTDANLLLGRIRPEQRFGEALSPDVDRARAALSSIGDPEEMARATIDVVNANMAWALRRVTLERGFDTAGFTLVPFGGAGPLHACELADELGFRRVLVPRHAGVLSALGMLASPEAVERTRGMVISLDGATQELEETAAQLSVEAVDLFTGRHVGTPAVRWSADVRYAGQAHELRVRFARPSPSLIEEAFHHAHRRRFGYNAPDRSVELVTLRVRAEGKSPTLPSQRLQRGGSHYRRSMAATAVHERERLAAADIVEGPAVITEANATSFIGEGWVATVDSTGNLVMERIE